MRDQSYSIAMVVDQSPQAVYAAINRVRDWWSGEIEGGTDKLGESFSYSVAGIHFSKQKITELVPGSKVVWHITDANLTFVKDKAEWIGTDLIFEISGEKGKTKLTFTHRGLVPEFECHEACTNGWNLLVGGNLRNLIATGLPQPSPW